MNSPTLSLLRDQNPKTPLPDSEDADPGVRGIFELGICIDCGRDDSVDGRAEVAGVVPALLLVELVLISDRGIGGRIGALEKGIGGGAIGFDDWTGAVRPGATGVLCLLCRLSCSSSISAFASAIAKFERVIFNVVRRELCE